MSESVAVEQAGDNHFSQLLDDFTKLVVIMVGLPARGKSFMAKKINKYLEHLGVQTKIFNLGSYRRLYTKGETVGKASSNFFDPNNRDAFNLREQCCTDALIDLADFFTNGGQAAIFDGTNSTYARRARINAFFEQKNKEGSMRVDCVFVESICNDEGVIRHNILKSKLKNPDYCTVDEQIAIDDFYRRIEQYEKQYRPVLKDEGSFIKIIDVGNEVIGHAINNYIALRVLYFVMHLNLKRKAFIRSDSINAKLDQMASPQTEPREEPPFQPPAWTRRTSFLMWKDLDADADSTRFQRIANVIADPSSSALPAHSSPMQRAESEIVALPSMISPQIGIRHTLSTPASGQHTPRGMPTIRARVSRRNVLLQKIGDIATDGDSVHSGSESSKADVETDGSSLVSIVPKDLGRDAPEACSMNGCDNVFDEDHPPHFCQLCGRIVCETCGSNEVPVEGNPGTVLRVCEVCVYETDSDSEVDEAESEFFSLHAQPMQAKTDELSTFRSIMLTRLGSLLMNAESKSKSELIREIRILTERLQKESELNLLSTGRGSVFASAFSNTDVHDG